ncbi:hypothetical protein GJAV_G00102110 [Gymnothorax javanicus]|nr:hypothetical protein GJAV_G00102110 [Gymnothorax javanicus]
MDGNAPIPDELAKQAANDCPRVQERTVISLLMQSLGSASSWPSCDSLSSGHSLRFSESEQTEDEADDAFLSEGEGNGGRGIGLDSPNEYPNPFIYGDVVRRSLKKDPTRQCPGPPGVILVSPSEAVKTRFNGQTAGDLIFAQKCAELRNFVRPLLELLNGLKRGKFDRGLSSFQQSVAMDRIQRIVGVLQNPTMGERYLHTLFQVEAMLKLWFPRVSPPTPPASVTTPISAGKATWGFTSHWRRDQLHIPVKKRRLSWRDADSLAQAPVPCKRSRQERPGCEGPLESGPVRPSEETEPCEKGEGEEAEGRTLTFVQHPSNEAERCREGNLDSPSACRGLATPQDAFVTSFAPLSLSPAPKPTLQTPELIAAEMGSRGVKRHQNFLCESSFPPLKKPLCALGRSWAP